MDPIQTAKKFLFTHRELKKRLDRAGTDIECLIGDLANKERINFIQRKVREWLELCLEIEEIIDELPIFEKTVIRYRYILGIPWEGICAILCDDPEQVSAIHKRALNRIYESIK